MRTSPTFSVYESDTVVQALVSPLSSLAPALQARTLTAHTVFGLTRYILTPAEAPIARHPLEFAFLLGLSSKLAWYPRELSGKHSLDMEASMKLLQTVANFWQRPIYDIDTLMMATRLSMFNKQEQWEIVCRVADFARIDCHYSQQRKDMKTIPETSKLPKEVHDRLLMNLASLEQSLLAKDPQMPNHLRNSHAILVSYPETVHLLEPHEVARLIDAAEIHTKTEIVKAVAAGKGAASKKKLDVSDL